MPNGRARWGQEEMVGTSASGYWTRSTTIRPRVSVTTARSSIPRTRPETTGESIAGAALHPVEDLMPAGYRGVADTTQLSDESGIRCARDAN